MFEVKIQDSYSCGNGWKPLIDEVLTEIIKYNETAEDKISLLDIKEKFGGLRIYIIPSIEYIEELIEKAENESYKICEVCGTKENVTTNRTGWHKTLCDFCRSKRGNN
jgi:hypothetical protein